MTTLKFDQVWNKLAEKGHCDAYGGAEYRRVRGEWEFAGRPPDLDLASFIRERANIGPLPT